MKQNIILLFLNMIAIIASVVKILKDVIKCVQPPSTKESVTPAQLNCLENRVSKLETELENMYTQEIVDEKLNNVSKINNIKLNNIESSQNDLKFSQQRNFDMVLHNSKTLSEMTGELKILMKALYHSKQ